MPTATRASTGVFEGTNEINRLLATGMLLKRAQRGGVPLVAAVKKLEGELLQPPGDDLVANAKKITLFALGLAFQKYLDQLDQQQEILTALADCAMQTYAMETVALRCERLTKSPLAADVANVFLRDAINTIEDHARGVLSACAEGDALRTNMAILRRLAKHDPVDSVAARRRISARLLETGKYLF